MSLWNIVYIIMRKIEEFFFKTQSSKQNTRYNTFLCVINKFIQLLYWTLFAYYRVLTEKNLMWFSTCSLLHMCFAGAVLMSFNKQHVLRSFLFLIAIFIFRDLITRNHHCIVYVCVYVAKSPVTIIKYISFVFIVFMF